MTSAAENQLKFSAPHLHTPVCGPYSVKYGSAYLAAKYCGFQQPPLKAPGLWQHGVIPESLELVSPNQIFGVTMSDLKTLQCWVATKRFEDFMRQRGFENVRAIGMPILYTQNRRIEHKQESLLVMPCHSSDAMDVDWDTNAYVNAIKSLKAQFREIVICVSAQCWARGMWIQEFQAAGFQVIRGADGKDKNTLEHMATLFQTFEFVTTNGYGSHLAYASAFGAKVSVFGPFAHLTVDSLKNEPFYIDNPDLLEPAAAASTEENVRKHYPAFFRFPSDAVDQTAMGRAAIGWDQKVSPEEMRALFGWTLFDRVAARGRRLKQRLVKKLVKHAPAPEELELKRLKATPRSVAGYADLFGRKIEFVDAPTYLQIYDRLFTHQSYRFRARTKHPLIIDGGANIGMSVLYFKCLYPQARVIAFEADPSLSKVLERNCETYELDDVEVIQKAFWTGDTEPGPLEAGSLSSDSGNAKRVTASACRLNNYLDQPVDLLKLSLEESGSEVLTGCIHRLRNVQNIIVEHHSLLSKPQDLNIAVDSLQKAGFRIYVEPITHSEQPLIQRKIVCGADVQVTLFGFRE